MPILSPPLNAANVLKALNAGSVGLGSTWQQQVTRTCFPNRPVALTGQTSLRVATRHANVSGDILSDPIVAFGNYNGGTLEGAGTQAKTIRCAIQDASQTSRFRQLTYNGSPDMVLAPDAELSFDPAYGFDCYGDLIVHTRYVTAATTDSFWADYLGLAGQVRTGEGYSFDQLADDNTAATGYSYSGTTTAYMPHPLRILTRLKTTQAKTPHIAVLGDSIATGLYDTAIGAGVPVYGYVARSLDALTGTAWSNFSTPGAKAADWYVSGRRRLNAIVAANPTLVYDPIGVNDVIANGSTFAIVQKALTQRWQSIMRRGIPVLASTIGMKTTSTDVWVSQQSPVTGFGLGSVQAQINDWIRSRPFPAPWFDYVEISDAISSGRNTGLWGNLAWVNTADGLGLHPSPAGMLVQAGVLTAKLNAMGFA